MQLSAAFESGSIEVVEATDPGNVRLRIPTDSASDYRMWFYFRVSGVRATALRLVFENAGECSYSSGWEGGYRVSASYDREDWFRVPTAYDGTTMTVSHMPILIAAMARAMLPVTDAPPRSVTWHQSSSSPR